MRSLTLIAALAALLLLAGLPARAQILLVDSDYRVVTIDKEGSRFSVALPDDDPDVPQNWVHIEMKTRSILPNGKEIDPLKALAHLKKGMVVKVNGGRRFDGEITAETLWFKN